MCTADEFTVFQYMCLVANRRRITYVSCRRPQIIADSTPASCGILHSAAFARSLIIFSINYFILLLAVTNTPHTMKQLNHLWSDKAKLVRISYIVIASKINWIVILPGPRELLIHQITP
jgi:hypothetical protein